ncbi:MAG: alpha/beta hydrolase [Anaerolineae bacterium]|nr:alpha/beta hydrolase [Anaerolineae bacterium]
MRMRLCTRALLLAKAASYVAALLAALLVTPLRPLGGWAVVLMWGKVAAGALAPFLVIGGSLGAIISLLRRDFRAALAGLAGAAAAARHIRRLAAPHAHFDGAFGPGWRDRIPPALAARMLMYRWPWQLGLLPPRAPYQAHISYAMWPKTAENRYCDVRLPPDDAPRTGLGVIYLHGGGWHYGDKALGTRPFFKHLAGQGHVIMDVAYTLAPKTDLCGMVADVKRAIAWMKTNAAALGVDPARVVLMGASAGAHLALLAAYTPNDPAFQPADVTMDTSVRAVVAFYPPVDIAALYRDLRGARRRLPDGEDDHGEAGNRHTGADPLHGADAAALRAVRAAPAVDCRPDRRHARHRPGSLQRRPRR